jgi:hypothetical protein
MGHNPYTTSVDRGEALNNLCIDARTFVDNAGKVVGFLTHSMRPMSDALTEIDTEKAHALLYDLTVACNGLTTALETYPVVPSDPGDQIVS